MFDFLYKVQVKTAVTIGIILLSIMMLVQSTLAIYNIYDSRETALEMSSLLISKDVENLSDLFSRIESFSKIMETDENFIYKPGNTVTGEILDDSKQFTALYEKFETMVSYSVKNSSFVSAYLFLREDLPLSYIAPRLENTFDLDSRIDSASIHSISDISHMDWMKKLEKSADSLIWVNKSGDRYILCFAKKISMWTIAANKAVINPLGVFYVSYDLASLIKQLELTSMYPSSVITLSYNDEIIYESDTDNDYRENDYVTHISSIYPGFKIITNISKREVSEPFNRQLVMGFVLIAITLWWGIAAITYIKRAMVHPVTNMARHLRADGNSEIDYNKPLCPEIKVLYNNHNHMVKQTREMMEENKKSYYKMLQSQINPHFIYNVINSISAVSLMKGDYEIAKTLSNLVEMIRYGINSPEDLVELEKEIELIKKFAEIQNFRYRNNIFVEYDVPDELLSVKLPKLTLQPLVENSIFHNDTNPATNKIYIKLKAEADAENVRIIIMDDNTVSPQKLNAHLSSTQEEYVANRRGLGIRNISQRLRFVFGEEYTLSYKSEAGRLCAVVTVPIENDI